MINLDDYANENKIKHNLKWPYIPHYAYIILIIGGSGSGKTNALLNLINNQPDIDKIYLYAKDPYESEEPQDQSTLMILKLLLSIQITCKMFTKTLMNTTRIKNAKN